MRNGAVAGAEIVSTRAWSDVLRRFLAVAGLAAALLVIRPSRAQSMPVPIAVQADLLVKIAAYDKSFPARAGDRVRVGLVTKRGHVESIRVAGQLKATLGDIGAIGGLPHEELLVEFIGAPALAKACREQHLAIVYLAPGLSDDIDAIRTALDGVSVLSVAAAPEYVQKGVVLGFDVRDAKTKLLLNQGQARKQGVAFRPEIVRLMTVFP
jgi:hypothetical protein